MTIKAPVSVCLITRGDERAADAVASVRPYVEEVILVHTCSPNDGFEVPGVDVVDFYDGCNDEQGRIEDFSKARNVSFAHATQPWVMWIDSDDVLAGGEHLAEVIDEADKSRRGKPARILAPYEYAYDEDGDCRMLQGRERIVTRGHFHWERPVHEGLVPCANTKGAVDLHTDRLVWRHLRGIETTKNVFADEPGRNERILRAVAIEARDARWALDLGVELANRGQVCPDEARRTAIEDDARMLFERAARDGNRAERALALMHLGSLEERTALRAVVEGGAPFAPQRAEDALGRALAAKDDWAEPRLALARLAYLEASAAGNEGARERALLKRVVRLAEEALRLPEATHPYPRDPRELSLRAHEWLHDAHARLGHPMKAQYHVDKALRAKPRAEHLLRAQKDYLVASYRKEFEAAARQLRKVGGLDDAALEVALQAAEHGKAAFARPHGAPAAAAPKGGALSIAFSCGQTLAQWDPDVLAREGLGGSETAVIELAKRLAAKGHAVTVYGNPTHEGRWDGVDYKRAGKAYFAREPVDVLVAWRNAALLDENNCPPSVRAKLLWVHDTEALQWTTERGFGAQRVLALSDWHKQHLMRTHLLHETHVAKFRNGIDLARFAGGAERGREPRRCIYSSSPDRGLETLLRVWPGVRERVPGAELHVFYGFDNWRKAADHLHDAQMMAQIDRLEKLLDHARPLGVRKRGKVDQHTLAREMLAAGAWAHPSVLADGQPFFETSCIGAMEAQAAGLRVVCGAHGALNETVHYGDKVDLFSTRTRYEDAFANALVVALEDRHTLKRESIMSHARVWGWDRACEQFEQIANAAIVEADAGELPAYQGAL